MSMQEHGAVREAERDAHLCELSDDSCDCGACTAEILKKLVVFDYDFGAAQFIPVTLWVNGD